MTPLDLRLKFKMDTGYYPVHSLNPTFRGKLKSIYGNWLEEKLGNKENLRKLYTRFSGFYLCPIYNKNYIPQDYIVWLEEKILTENICIS